MGKIYYNAIVKDGQVQFIVQDANNKVEMNLSRREAEKLAKKLKSCAKTLRRLQR